MKQKQEISKVKDLTLTVKWRKQNRKNLLRIQEKQCFCQLGQMKYVIQNK